MRAEERADCEARPGGVRTGEQLGEGSSGHDEARRPAVSVEVAALGEGDHPIGQPSQLLGLRQARLDALVLDERGDHVLHHRHPMRVAPAHPFPEAYAPGLREEGRRRPERRMRQRHAREQSAQHTSGATLLSTAGLALTDRGTKKLKVHSQRGNDLHFRGGHRTGAHGGRRGSSGRRSRDIATSCLHRHRGPLASTRSDLRSHRLAFGVRVAVGCRRPQCIWAVPPAQPALTACPGA